MCRQLAAGTADSGSVVLDFQQVGNICRTCHTCGMSFDGILLLLAVDRAAERDHAELVGDDRDVLGTDGHVVVINDGPADLSSGLNMLV